MRIRPRRLSESPSRRIDSQTERSEGFGAQMEWLIETDLQSLLLQPIRTTKGTHFDARGNKSFRPRSGIASHRVKSDYLQSNIRHFGAIYQFTEALSARMFKYRGTTHKSIQTNEICVTL